MKNKSWRTKKQLNAIQTNTEQKNKLSNVFTNVKKKKKIAESLINLQKDKQFEFEKLKDLRFLNSQIKTKK